MADYGRITALLERLKKELDGKLECSANERAELDALLRELEEARCREVSAAERRALIGKALAVFGFLLKFIPEIGELFRD